MEHDKEHLLKESKVFCMFPWSHLNVTPKGDVYPCCSNNYTKPFANTKETSLKEAFNHDFMKELRLKMLKGEKSEICDFCYKHEEASPYSFRTYSIDHFGKHFDELIPMMEPDGTMPEFRMHYFDIRFSNICNFKCRTCGDEFSSQWAQESRVHDKTIPIVKHVDDHKGNVLNEVLDQVDNIELAYFAGGEPTLTEEHYIMLEDMIRKGKTDIILRYNTNASNIKFKDYDLLDLWKNFKRIELSCSIDHYGERAEWLRKGTDWGVVESNLLRFRNLDYVDFQLNTVFSIFNYYTIGEFYQYLIDKTIIRPNDWYHSLYLAVHPLYYSAKSMPKKMKPWARTRAKSFINGLNSDYNLLNNLINGAINFADEKDSWADSKKTFWQHTNSIDRIRQEDFLSVFPELKQLQTLDE